MDWAFDDTNGKILARISVAPIFFFMSLRVFRAINTFLPVNASLHWLNNVSCLVLSTNWRCAITEGTVGFFKGWTEVPYSLRRCGHWSVAPGRSDYYWTTVNTTWRIACLIQELCRLSLRDTNITPIQNNKMQPASSFTFSPAQLYSTFNWGDWKK